VVARRCEFLQCDVQYCGGGDPRPAARCHTYWYYRRNSSSQHAAHTRDELIVQSTTFRYAGATSGNSFYSALGITAPSTRRTLQTKESTGLRTSCRTSVAGQSVFLGIGVSFDKSMEIVACITPFP